MCSNSLRRNLKWVKQSPKSCQQLRRKQKVLLSLEGLKHPWKLQGIKLLCIEIPRSAEAETEGASACKTILQRYHEPVNGSWPGRSLQKIKFSCSLVTDDSIFITESFTSTILFPAFKFNQEIQARIRSFTLSWGFGVLGFWGFGFRV